MDDEQFGEKSRKHGQEVRRHGEEVRRDNDIKINAKNVIKIKNARKIQEALDLPTLCNLNPRSIYNKIDEFHEFVKQESVHLIFMSESWERENLTLEKVIKLKNYEVISNVSQRKGQRGDLR